MSWPAIIVLLILVLFGCGEVPIGKSGIVIENPPITIPDMNHEPVPFDCDKYILDPSKATVDWYNRPVSYNCKLDIYCYGPQELTKEQGYEPGTYCLPISITNITNVVTFSSSGFLYGVNPEYKDAIKLYFRKGYYTYSEIAPVKTKTTVWPIPGNWEQVSYTGVRGSIYTFKLK